MIDNADRAPLKFYALGVEVLRRLRQRV